MKFIYFFIPFFITYFVKDSSVSYLISWLGSIFLIVYSIYTDQRNNGRKLKFFSPLILSQGLFWGYTAITSIFYFIDQQGYQYFEKFAFPNHFEINTIANTQKYIVFAHACYLTGYFLYQKRQADISEFNLQINTNTYLKLSLGATLCALVVLKTPFAQLSSYLNIFSTLCAVKYLGYSLENRKILFKALLYFITIMLIGFLSGMKESTLFPIIYLGVILYDKYGIKRTSLVFVPLIIAYFYFIPTVNTVVRNATWYENKGAFETFGELKEANIYDAEKIKSNNWAFLTTRLSEISMLNRYIESVPSRRPYYGFEIYKYGIQSLVPRFLWPSKQSPDVTAQQRAVENGALVLNSPYDFTSAKPQTIADAYMSFGYFSIFFTFLIYGYLVHYFYVLLELKFGYDLGVSILFYSLFSVLSKGGCFENLFNTTFYGFVLVYITAYIFKRLNIIEINPEYIN